MKRFISICLTTLLLLAVNTSVELAQDGAQKNAVQNVVKTLFNYSKSKDFNKAAKLIAYEGDDQSRVYKDSYNPANKDEMNHVKRICKKISALMDISNSYEMGDFSVKKNPEGDHYVQEVLFVSGDQKLKTVFQFIQINGTYLLAAID